MGRLRTLQVCISDIPEDRILKHENGKQYIFLKTYDYEQTNERDDDFSISLVATADEQKRIKAGEKINQIYVGTGKIWNR